MALVCIVCGMKKEVQIVQQVRSSFFSSHSLLCMRCYPLCACMQDQWDGPALSIFR